MHWGAIGLEAPPLLLTSAPPHHTSTRRYYASIIHADPLSPSRRCFFFWPSFLSLSLSFLCGSFSKEPTLDAGDENFSRPRLALTCIANRRRATEARKTELHRNFYKLGSRNYRRWPEGGDLIGRRDVVGRRLGMGGVTRSRAARQQQQQQPLMDVLLSVAPMEPLTFPVKRVWIGSAARTRVLFRRRSFDGSH